MTISSSNRTAGPFAGNDATTVFPFYFKVFAQADVLAVRTKNDTSTSSNLVLNGDYTVALNADQNANPGGSVTLSAPLASGYSLVLTSQLDYLQPLDLTNAGGFYPKVITDTFDRIVIFIQQLASIATRSLRFPVADTGANTELPNKSNRANNLLGFDANGNPVAVAPAAQSATALQGLLAASNGSSLVGFIEAAANAVARTIQDKVREIAVSPEDFGAKGDGSDDTLALAWMAACIKTVGSGRISFGPGKTYSVLPTGGTAGNKLMDFTGVAGLIMEGNGARILTGNVTVNQMLICLDSASLVRMSNLKLESGYQVLNSNAGIDWIVAGNGAHELLFDNIDLKWGVCGICPRGPAVGSGTDANRTRNIVVRNLTTSGTYYPVNLQGAGDNFVGNIRSRNAGRSFFAYNMRNAEVLIDSEHGGPFSDVLLKVYGSTTWDSRLDNIKVRYSTRTRYAGSGNQNADEGLVALDFQLNNANPAACKMQDIDITFDVDASPADKMQSLFVVRKYDSTGAADTTAGRGHELIGLTLRGTGRALQNLLGDAVRLFTRTPDNWAGESLYNITVDGLVPGGMAAGQNALTIDGNGLVGPCSVRGVVTAGNLTKSNMTGKDFVVDASTFGNFPQFTRVPKDYNATWTADTTAPVLGSGTLQTKYSVRNGWCTVTGKLALGASSTTGAGIWHISLPFTHSNNDYAVLGSAKGLVAGNFYTGVCEVQPNAGTLELMLGGTTGNYVNAATPGAWGSGHHVEFSITYPIA